MVGLKSPSRQACLVLVARGEDLGVIIKSTVHAASRSSSCGKGDLGVIIKSSSVHAGR